MILFVDSSAHIARIDEGDQHYGAALGVLESLRATRLVTSTFILDEVATRGTALVGARATVKYIEGILSNPLYHVAEVTSDLLKEALQSLVKYEDQGLSFTDCATTVLMRAARIKTIFTFDNAFRNIGFQVVP
jgi:hypothetical protein